MCNGGVWFGQAAMARTGQVCSVLYRIGSLGMYRSVCDWRDMSAVRQPWWALAVVMCRKVDSGVPAGVCSAVSTSGTICQQRTPNRMVRLVLKQSR